ncbi:hypothetical protein Syun_021815 [Stephania yunnanensis]|uniref:Uncharacterized protein n=1 Tax=Stephania yunnanensis TaxID=152371 RepID=A0AAP0IGG3_9MAGN
MAAINVASKPTQESFFFSLDPKTSLLSLNSETLPPVNLCLERGPRYREYSELRELKLKLKHQQYQQQQLIEIEEPEPTLTPPKKRVTFQGGGDSGRRAMRRSASMVAQSVPDFSAVLRKENRRPAEAATMTPPSKGAAAGKAVKLSGSRSAGGGEKKGGGGAAAAARKSYASIEELRGLGAGVGNAINGVGGRSGRNYKILGQRLC